MFSFHIIMGPFAFSLVNEWLPFTLMEKYSLELEGGTVEGPKFVCCNVNIPDLSPPPPPGGFPQGTTNYLCSQNV